MILRWVEKKLGLVIEEFLGLQTNLNLRTDLIGSLAKMLSTMSSGRWLFLCRRIGGSLAWDILLKQRDPWMYVWGKIRRVLVQWNYVWKQKENTSFFFSFFGKVLLKWVFFFLEITITWLKFKLSSCRLKFDILPSLFN